MALNAFCDKTLHIVINKFIKNIYTKRQNNFIVYFEQHSVKLTAFIAF